MAEEAFPTLRKPSRRLRKRPYPLSKRSQSHLSTWRRQQYEIAKSGGLARKGSRKAADLSLKRLERENARLRRKLEQAEAIFQIQQKSLRAVGDSPESARQRRERLIMAAEQLAREIGKTAPACETLGVSRATLYRPRGRRVREARPRTVHQST